MTLDDLAQLWSENLPLSEIGDRLQVREARSLAGLQEPGWGAIGDSHYESLGTSTAALGGFRGFVKSSPQALSSRTVMSRRRSSLLSRSPLSDLRSRDCWWSSAGGIAAGRSARRRMAATLFAVCLRFSGDRGARSIAGRSGALPLFCQRLTRQPCLDEVLDDEADRPALRLRQRG
jgi:hypothetical protein